MKPIYFSLASFLLLIAFSCTSCRDDDEPTLTCTNGLEVINDSCQCPAEKFMIGSTCRALNDNEYWAIMPNEYPCRDTFFIEFGTIDTIAGLIKYQLIVLRPIFNDVIPVNAAFNSMNYENSSSGGEFNNGGDGYPFCEINGINTGSYWEGKFISDTEVYVKMYHRNITDVYDIIDSTEVTFRR